MILVTGASGLVGLHLIKQLSEKDIPIRALYYSSIPKFLDNTIEKNIEWFQCDVLDIISLEITPISNSKNFLIELDQFLPKSFDFYRERRLGWVPIDRSNPHWTDHLGVFQNLILVNRH